MKEFEIIASVVLYQNPVGQVERLLKSFENQDVNYFLFLIDNSPSPVFSDRKWPDNVKYLHTGKNLGYGRGHNLGILDTTVHGHYHLICNPDVYFDKGTLSALVKFMDQNTEVGTTMPDVRYPDGTRQHLIKLAPQPSDLFLRRFLPKGFSRLLFREAAEKYLLKDFDPEKPLSVPILSGCFLFVRRQLLQYVDGFDPRYFLYLEDVDLSRRLFTQAENVFFPEVKVVHEYQKDSYKKPKHLLYHISSAVKYFNKFGWFRDEERQALNRRAFDKNSPYRKV